MVEALASLRHVLITGASGGIGAACMRVFHAAGWHVSGIARRADHLRALQAELGQRCHVAVADVTDDAALTAAVRDLAQAGPFDLVIANAGRGLDGELLELAAADIAALFELNVLAVHRTVQAARPLLAPRARVQLLASVASFLPIPRMGAYCASKAALDSYGAALRMELREAGIAVTTVHPGTVATDFFTAAPKRGGVWDWRPGTALSAQAVARRLLRAARGRAPRRVSLPWFAALVGWLYWRLPWLVEGVLARRLAEMRQRDVGTQTGAETGAENRTSTGVKE